MNQQRNLQHTGLYVGLLLQPWSQSPTPLLVLWVCGPASVSRSWSGPLGLWLQPWSLSAEPGLIFRMAHSHI